MDTPKEDKLGKPLTDLLWHEQGHSGPNGGGLGVWGFLYIFGFGGAFGQTRIIDRLKDLLHPQRRRR